MQTVKQYLVNKNSQIGTLHFCNSQHHKLHRMKYLGKKKNLPQTIHNISVSCKQSDTPKNSQLNIKIFSFYNKDKTTDRTLLTKETELSKLSHNIVILNTDQLTLPLYTSMKDSITTTKGADSVFANLFCTLSDEPREHQYIFNPDSRTNLD